MAHSQEEISVSLVTTRKCLCLEYKENSDSMRSYNKNQDQGWRDILPPRYIKPVNAIKAPITGHRGQPFTPKTMLGLLWMTASVGGDVKSTLDGIMWWGWEGASALRSSLPVSSIVTQDHTHSGQLEKWKPVSTDKCWQNPTAVSSVNARSGNH